MEVLLTTNSFLIIWSKKTKTVQTNMVAYVVCTTDFTSEVRSDLWGCLEAIVAAKPHFLCWSPIDGSSFSFHNEPIYPKIFKNPLNRLQKSSQINKNQILNFPHVSRNSIRSEPCCSYTISCYSLCLLLNISFLYDIRNILQLCQQKIVSDVLGHCVELQVAELNRYSRS